jgi:hypothetical protein
MKNKEFVTIGRFNRLMDAYLIASRIESEGIECFLPGEKLAKSPNNYFTKTSQIKLQVRKEDATKALRILKDETFDTSEDASTGP